MAKKTDTNELIISSDNARESRAILRGLKDKSLDSITIDPDVFGTHTQYLGLVNESYRILRDGGKLRVAAIDVDQYTTGQAATIKNHFTENDFKSFFINKTTFETAEFGRNGILMVIQATKKIGKVRSMTDTLILKAKEKVSGLTERNGNEKANETGPAGEQKALVDSGGMPPNKPQESAPATRGRGGRPPKNKPAEAPADTDTTKSETSTENTSAETAPESTGGGSLVSEGGAPVTPSTTADPAV